MFVPLNDAAPMSGPMAGPVLRPAHSLIAATDWAVLARYWYPIAVAGDVQAQPVRGKLLDVELVIYAVEGKIAVAQDLCPHRQVRLSAGRVIDDRLVCPFHGLAFNAEGRCTKVPALGRQAKLPESYRLRSIRSTVRYGLVWACLAADSHEAVPEFARADEVGLDHLAFGTVRDWPVSAPLQIENYIDIAHLPFVHGESLGGDPEAAVGIPQVEHNDQQLIMRASYDHVLADGASAVIDYLNVVTLPFNAYTDAKSSKDHAVGQDIMAYQMWNLAAPISAHQCRVFSVFVTAEPSPSRQSRPSLFNGDAINLEDIRLLEQMAVADYPLDEKRLIHLPVDNVSNHYRRRLRELGLGRSA